MTKTSIAPTKQHPTWFSRPQPNHVVHFYPHDEDLMASLVAYCDTGLRNGDTCIVIATQDHLIRLNAALRAGRIDVLDAVRRDQYLMYDAGDMLAGFMDSGLPDYQKFVQSVGYLITRTTGSSTAVRAFGEMVALLWEEGNLEGAIQLETYWHDLVQERSFSLYCAYLRSRFDDSSEHEQAIARICDCHAVVLGST